MTMVTDHPVEFCSICPAHEWGWEKSRCQQWAERRSERAARLTSTALADLIEMLGPAHDEEGCDTMADVLEEARTLLARQERVIDVAQRTVAAVAARGASLPELAAALAELDGTEEATL